MDSRGQQPPAPSGPLTHSKWVACKDHLREQEAARKREKVEIKKMLEQEREEKAEKSYQRWLERQERRDDLRALERQEKRA